MKVNLVIGSIAVAVAILAWGSFTVPTKSKQVLEKQLDPLVFQVLSWPHFVLIASRHT